MQRRASPLDSKREISARPVAAAVVVRVNAGVVVLVASVAANLSMGTRAPHTQPLFHHRGCMFSTGGEVRLGAPRPLTLGLPDIRAQLAVFGPSRYS